MGAGAAQVGKDFGIGAAALLEGIRQNGKSLRGKVARMYLPIIVGSPGEPGDGALVPAQPCGINTDRMEGAAFNPPPHEEGKVLLAELRQGGRKGKLL